MGEKIKETAVIISQEEISEDIYSMWIKTKASKTAKPGQFVALNERNRQAISGGG